MTSCNITPCTVKTVGLVFLALTICFVSSSRAVTISSTFDTDIEGWTTDPREEPGTLTHQAAGGNPGGFIRIDDTLGANIFSYLEAPGEFLGDLQAFVGGQIAFDGILLAADSNQTAAFFGTVTISSPDDTASLDLAPDPLPTSWTSYSASLTADTWGVTESDWNNLLANVTSLRLDLEPILGDNEVVGIDNFVISAIPEPSGLWICGLSLATIAALSRRRPDVQRGSLRSASDEVQAQ